MIRDDKKVKYEWDGYKDGSILAENVGVNPYDYSEFLTVREAWAIIKKKDEKANNYIGFCVAYKEAERLRGEYIEKNWKNIK